ncbi:MAG: hypothetical protein P8075_15220 [Deltaproteobacteria bacterium]|jgi:hypothetical protein
MTETIIVFIIAGVAFALSARWLYRIVAGRSEGCGCGENCGSAAASGDGIKDEKCRP